MSYIICLISLVAGGLLGRQGYYSSWWWYMAAVILVLSWWRLRDVRWSPVLLAVCLGCMLGGRMTQVLPDGSFRISEYSGRQVVVNGIVNSQPKQSIKSLQVRLDEVEVEGVDDWQGSVQLSLPVHSQVQYGDRLKLVGKMQDVEDVDSGYAEYLINHQIYGMMVWPDIVDRQSAESMDMIGWGIWLQEQSVSRIERLLPQDVAAFLMGIVLGSERMISEDFDQALRITGTSHIVVASGYNVGILVGVAVKLAQGRGRYWVTGLAILLVILFGLISGLEASLIRASLMAGLALLAMLWGRQKEAAYFLLVTAVCMLVVNPWWLFDAGFQLSFMATLSLITFQPMVSRRLEGILSPWLREVVSSTVSAQILVYPILWVLFGSLSMVSLLTNVLVLWLVPWLMLAGFCLLLVSWVSSGLAQWLAYGVYPWLWFVRQIVVWTSKIPAATIAIQANWWWACGYYLVHWMIYKMMSNYEQTS